MKLQENYRHESYNEKENFSAGSQDLKAIRVRDSTVCLNEEKKEMVNQTNNNISREINKLNENEFLAVVNYISQLLSKRISKQTNQTSDDLIVSLADAYENKRARQVVEWEKMRRQSLGRAS